jgi:hypothetical protein
MDCARGSDLRYAGMPNRKWAIVVFIVAFCFLFAVSRTSILRHWGQTSRPLGDAPRIEFSSDGVSQLAVEHFLDGDFTIITNVKALPNPVLKALTESTGSRLLMANPGEKFEATDFISDSSVPRMRLIFAGIRNDESFVHYEQGGRGRIFIVALFKLASANEMEPFWRGYCTGPAHNLEELRSKVMNRECR